MKASSIGLDTSVVLRLLVGEPQDQAERAIHFLRDKARDGVELFVSDLVVCETYFALHSHYGVPKKEAISTMLQMFDDGPVLPMPGSAVVRTLRESLASSAKPGFIDRLIHATYRSAGAEMACFEKASKRLEGCTVL